MCPSKCAAYRGDFRGYGDWLGTGITGYDQRAWASFDECVAFVRGLRLTSKHEWDAYCHAELVVQDEQGAAITRPETIPLAPEHFYADDWCGWSWLLGTWEPPAVGKYLAFEACRELARSLGLEDRAAWRTFVRGRPAKVPRHPNAVYAPSWRGWSDWLGIEVAEPTATRDRGSGRAVA